MYRHWQYEKDADNIFWLTFNRQSSSVNTINAEVLEELHSFLQMLEALPKPPLGLVIQSGKENGFIAGADIHQFENVKSAEEATSLIEQGQKIFEELEKVSFPTLALIQGFCLGGGLELALACRYRIAIDDPKTRFGTPEVLLGIHPGWGGTVRLPRLIGIFSAMDLMLSGRSISAKEAGKMGLVDVVVPKRQYMAAVKYYLNSPLWKRGVRGDFLNRKSPPSPPFIKVGEHILNLEFVRPLIGKFLYRKLRAKVNPAHYPAPFAIVDNWVEHGISKQSAFESEIKSISQLMVSDTAKNLLRVFHLQETLKNLSRESLFKPRHIHVVGAGVMGGDIAAWCALKGFKVTLQDTNLKAIAASLKRAKELFTKQLKEPYRVKAAMDRLMPDVEGLGISKSDIIIEAIIENKEAKQALFKNIEKLAKPEAILASNTSTIPLEEIAETLQSGERLVGIHFFNPVAKMSLVEVISDNKTDPLVTQCAIAFVRCIDKLPLPVRSAPGFLINRLLMPYLMEGVRLLSEGLSKTVIDRAAIEFGMPMGPIELADMVGLDVCLLAGESLSHHFGGQVPNQIRELVAKGHLGKKTGRGFYEYKKGKPVKEKLDINYQIPEDITDRLMFRMFNEALACLREGIVADANLLDAGMIFGAGFPPFRGGPLHYIAEEGKPYLMHRLNVLAERYGDQFLADRGWSELDVA